MKRLLGILLVMIICLGVVSLAVGSGPADSNISYLKKIVSENPNIKTALLDSLQKANWKGITTLDKYYAYLERTEKLVPQARSILDNLLEFYYLIDQSPALDKSDLFQGWVNRFAKDWGKFLDTPESIKHLATFYEDKDFHMDDYFVAPSGWMSFNQFFARQVKPGKRPVASPCDDSVIVSPADSVYQGVWPISENSTISAKGRKYSITQLLADSKFKDFFKGGIFTHSFLNVNDYHRYHTPVAGKLLEKKVILGRMVLGVAKDPKTGKLVPVDDEGWQVTQARGLIVLQTKSLGLVAVLPIGMAQVSSVTLTPDVGADLAKGQEFGFFQFGGSDIITIYQKDKVEFTAKKGVHYKQGEKLGQAIK